MPPTQAKNSWTLQARTSRQHAPRLLLPPSLAGIRTADKLRLRHFSKCNFQKLSFLANRIANNEYGRNSMFLSIPCYSNQEHSQIRPLRHLPCGASLLGNSPSPGPVSNAIALQDPQVTNGEAEQRQSCFTGRWYRRREQRSPFATPFCRNALKTLDSAQVMCWDHCCSCCQSQLVTRGPGCYHSDNKKRPATFPIRLIFQDEKDPAVNMSPNSPLILTSPFWFVQDTVPFI